MHEHDAGRPKGGIKGDSGRKDRLAEALRANLRKRKEQSRVRAAPKTRPKDATPAKDDDRTP